jgi:hypothetical protein
VHLELVAVTQQEISYLYAVWEQLNAELAEVEKLLPMTRQKRGLLNFFFGGGRVEFFVSYRHECGNASFASGSRKY